MNAITIEKIEISSVCTGKYRFMNKRNKHSSAKNTGKKYRKEKSLRKKRCENSKTVVLKNIENNPKKLFRRKETRRY